MLPQKDWVYMKIEPTDIKRNRVLSSLFKYEKSKFEMKEGIKLLSPSYIYEHVKNNAKPYVKEVHKNLLDMPVDVIDFILSSYVF